MTNAALVVRSGGWLLMGSERFRCALGRRIVAADAKREVDGATPAGAWPLRRLLYRPDREPPPTSRLPLRAIAADDGWCDAPEDPLYNQPVRLPYGASAEALWRDDGLYDLLVVLGHNEPPARPGAGSAIFLHLAKPDFSPTRGCVAVARGDMLALLEQVQPGDDLEVRLG